MRGRTRPTKNMPMNETKLSLYDIERGLQELLEMSVQAEESGALPEEQKAIEDAIAEYFRREVRKVDGIAHAYQTFICAAETLKAEIDRLTARMKTFHATAQRIKNGAYQAMVAHGVTKLETPVHTLRIQANGGKAAVEVDNWEQLPGNYIGLTIKLTLDQVDSIAALPGALLAGMMIIKREPLLEEIREELSHGKTVPGAKLKERGEHLRIT